MKKTTLKKKFLYCLLVICISFVLVICLLIGMLYYSKKRMETFIDINNEVYGLKRDVNALADAYNYYTISGKEEDLSNIIERKENLLLNSIVLKNDVFVEAYVREIEDLTNMTKTLVEEVQKEIDSFSGYLRIERIASLERISYTVSLIDKYYDYVYIAIENFTSERQVHLKKEIDVLRLALLFLIAVVFFIVIFMIRWFQKQVIRPITQLAYRVSTFRTNEPDLQQTEQDEIHQLNATFEAMVIRIEQQVDQIKLNMELELRLKQQKLEHVKIEKLLQESEIKALQARINPHFLFNTLNSIAQMAYLEDAEQTEKMIEAVSDYFRYNLKDIDHISSIAEEVKNVRDYIYIQKIRFGNRIHFMVDYDETISKGKLPALTLQPIVENAIVHGLGLVKENGIIQITIGKVPDKKYIVISISDNGVGMNDMKLDLINDYIAMKGKKGIKSDSIGLKNVIDRLRLLFGNSFTMKVSSSEHTVIEFVIPYEESICIKC